MRNRFKLSIVLALVFSASAIAGCSSVDAVTDTIDCRQVCSRYADCFNKDYDVDGCEDKCKNNADTDAQRQSKLRACDDCIGDKSCTSATFNCADECAGTVP
jgi:hypothetical protein